MRNNSDCQFCSACGQRKPKPRVVKISKLLLAFNEIANASNGDWVRVPAFKFQGTHAQMKYWGIIEDQTYVNKNGEERRRSGVWRVTAQGKAWKEGRVTIPAEAVILLDKVQSFSSTRISYVEAQSIASDPKKLAKIEEEQWEFESRKESSEDDGGDGWGFFLDE